MGGNEAYYKNIHFLYAKYTSSCPECEKKIEPGQSIVYMSEFGVSMHFDCFYHGPVISYPDKNLSAQKEVIIDPHFSLKTQFMILLYRLKKRNPPKSQGVDICQKTNQKHTLKST